MPIKRNSLEKCNLAMKPLRAQQIKAPEFNDLYPI